jgi:ABC-type dipeptide/oligopeptide/nickel transport system permease component
MMLAKRLVALAATVVLAPTVAYVAFNGLSGNLGGTSLPVFAWDYAVRTFWHHDLGVTASYGQSVSRVIWWSLPADLALVIGGIVAGIVLGVSGGVYCAAHPRTVATRALHATQAFVLSSPPYWYGLMVLVLFSPGTGYLLQIPFVSGVMEYQSLAAHPLLWLQSLWVPWVMIGLPLAAGVLRMTESQLQEALGEDYVRTALAKGLTPARVLRRHALPVAIAPVAAFTGATMPLLITNVALMESAFNIPGIYREIRSIGAFADYPLLQGVIIETTVIIVVANMIADAIQARLDPTVR